MADIHKAIRNTHPTVITINGDKDAWDKDGNVVVLDEAKIEAEMTKLQAEWDSQEYARKRKLEYPSIEECVHAILDDEVDALQIKRKAVKDKYPKE